MIVTATLTAAWAGGAWAAQVCFRLGHYFRLLRKTASCQDAELGAQSSFLLPGCWFVCASSCHRNGNGQVCSVLLAWPWSSPAAAAGTRAASCSNALMIRLSWAASQFIKEHKSWSFSNLSSKVLMSERSQPCVSNLRMLIEWRLKALGCSLPSSIAAE